MDSTIKHILGENEPLEMEPEETGPGAMNAPGDRGPGRHDTPIDAEIDELANLWISGNKGEVVERYMEMDNEKSVHLVFAIGLDGALELARIVDQRLKQNPEDEEIESTEPERIEPPATGDHNSVHEIIGKTRETPEAIAA